MLEHYPDYLTPSEIKEILGVSSTTIYNLMKENIIPAFKLGKRMWRISKQCLINYLEKVDGLYV